MNNRSAGDDDQEVADVDANHKGSLELIDQIDDFRGLKLQLFDYFRGLKSHIFDDFRDLYSI